MCGILPNRSHLPLLTRYNRILSSHLEPKLQLQGSTSKFLQAKISQTASTSGFSPAIQAIWGDVQKKEEYLLTLGHHLVFNDEL